MLITLEPVLGLLQGVVSVFLADPNLTLSFSDPTFNQPYLERCLLPLSSLRYPIALIINLIRSYFHHLLTLRPSSSSSLFSISTLRSFPLFCFMCRILIGEYTFWYIICLLEQKPDYYQNMYFNIIIGYLPLQNCDLRQRASKVKKLFSFYQSISFTRQLLFL